MIYDVSHKIFWGSGSVNIKLSKNRRENHQAWTFQPSLKHGKGWSCWDRRKGPCSDLTTGMGAGGNGLCFKHVQQKCDWRNWLFGQTGGSSLREVPIFWHFWVVQKSALTSSCFADLSKRQGCELFHGSFGKIYRECAPEADMGFSPFAFTWWWEHIPYLIMLSLSLYIYMVPVYIYIYIDLYIYIYNIIY